MLGLREPKMPINDGGRRYCTQRTLSFFSPANSTARSRASSRNPISSIKPCSNAWLAVKICPVAKSWSFCADQLVAHLPPPRRPVALT